MILNYLGILTILSYLSIAVAQGLHLFEVIHCSRWRYVAGSLVSISGHGWILYKLIETPEGQNLDWLLMLSFTLWLMNIFIILTNIKAKIENLSIFTYPLAALAVGLTLTLGGSMVINTKAQPFVAIHVLLSLTAMSLLALASFQAILMGLQNFLLKHHRPSPILKILPPLQTMEALLFNIIWVSMLFFSASLVSGFLFHIGLLTRYLFPKTLLALIAWCLLCLLLIGRYLFGWRGPTAIRWTLSGAAFALLSYFGTKALLA